MLVTSTPEVSTPGFSDLLIVFDYRPAEYDLSMTDIKPLYPYLASILGLARGDALGAAVEVLERQQVEALQNAEEQEGRRRGRKQVVVARK